MIQKFHKITFDQKKRDRVFVERGLAFEEAGALFTSASYTLIDDRYDYGEVRYLSYGNLHGRGVVIVWTERDDAAHIISMRHCHEKEIRKFKARMG